MNKLILVIYLFGLQALSISCTKDINGEATQPLPEETLLDVSYGSHQQEKYDLYLPAGRSSEKTKVIVLVHGGGWTGGDKADMALFLPYIKMKHPDHAIANINYVLADTATAAFPNQFLNVAAVLNKLTAAKEELQILPEYALIGASAGAHISLMYDYVYDTDDQVKMVADIVGPADFTDPFYSQNPDFNTLIAALVDENSYPPGTNYAEVLSPALQVSDESSPTLLFYGNTDPLVPLSNAETLNDALSIAQVDHNFTVYEGGHGNWAPADYNNMNAQISAFVDTYLEINE